MDVSGRAGSSDSGWRAWLTARRWIPRAYPVFVAGFVVASAWLALRDHYRIPTFDDWRILDDFFSTPLLEWTFGQQNGHFVPLTLLLLHLDYVLLSGRMHLLVIASLGCAGLAAVVLGKGLAGGSELRSPVRETLVGFVWFALFWAGGCYEFAWGMNQGTVLAILWLCVALACLARGRTGDSPRLLLGAGLAAWLATFSHGMGFATWPAVLGVSLAARLPGRVSAAYALGAMATLTCYLVALGDAKTASPESLATQLVEHPLEYAAFGAAFVGSAAGRVASGFGTSSQAEIYAVSVLAGSAGLAAAAALSVAALRRGRPTATQLVGLGLVVCVVAASGIVALSRLPRFPNAADSRFATFATLFWVGLLAILLSTPTVQSNRGRRGLAAALVVLLSVAMLPAFSKARADQDVRRRRLEQWSNAFLLGIESDGLAREIALFEPERVFRVSARLRQDRRSFFSDPRAELPGSRIDDRFRPGGAGRCRGATREVRGFYARGMRAAELRGWAVDAAQGKPPAYVVIVDADSRVRGLGTVTERSVVAVPGARRWIAYVADFDPGARYAAYGVLQEEGIACPLEAPGSGGSLGSVGGGHEQARQEEHEGSHRSPRLATARSRPRVEPAAVPRRGDIRRAWDAGPGRGAPDTPDPGRGDRRRQ